MRTYCCRVLEDNLTGVNGQGAGLHALEVTRATDCRKRIAGVYLRKERKRRVDDKGLLIRFCPFCGSDLEEHFAALKKAVSP